MVVFSEVNIKYTHLDNILDDIIRNITFSNKVNIVIDLKEIFRKVFRPNILDMSPNKSRAIEELASDVINIISHYRNYFSNKGKYTTFYFLYSKSECELLKAINPEYKKEYYEKHFNDDERKEKIEIIDKVVQLLEIIIPKIPNANMIDTSKYDEFIISKFISTKIKKNELSFILSIDPTFAQLLSDNIFMLNIKGINTKLLSLANATSIITKKETSISSNLLSLVFALGGVKYYNLRKIDNIGLIRGLRIVEGLIKKEIITDNTYLKFPISLDKLNVSIKDHRIIFENYDEIKENYDLISGSPMYSNITDITTLFNIPKEIKPENYFLELNAKVFNTYPLRIKMMLKGEQV